MIINSEFNEMIKTISQGFQISESECKNAVIRSYRFLENSNFARLKKVIAKAKRGEKLTICGIGGSITEGALAKSYPNGTGNNKTEFNEALGGEKCWFRRISEWFGTQYGIEVDSFNAGIGATPSFLGVHRLDSMVLDKNPDLVTIEFSVNDPAGNKLLRENEIFQCYEAILRRALEKGCAVILVFTVEEKGTSYRDIHSKIGGYYKVPMVSYHDAIYPDKCITDWKNTSPDEIHPNNVGHSFISVCIENMIKNAETEEEEKSVPIPEKWFLSDTFYKTQHLYASRINPESNTGFELHPVFPKVSNKWEGVLYSNTAGAQISFEIPKGAKKVFITFNNSDGEFKAQFLKNEFVCDASSTGWPKPVWLRVYDGSALPEKALINITLQKGEIEIIGLEISY